MSNPEYCPLTEEPCHRKLCKDLMEKEQDPVCMKMVDFLRRELTDSTLKQYFDPEHKTQYQLEYIHKTRIVQETYDFTLDEYLLLLVRVGQDFNAREVLKTYLGSQGLNHLT